MNNRNGKWWLAVALCCLAPAAAFASRAQAVQNGGCKSPSAKNCQQVPEGGSTAIYLLGAAITCVGAMFLRSRAAKPTQS
jgi:hypothetical protein